MIDDWTNDVHCGDAFDLLDDLPEDSVHAVVTDPPYGLAFMGRSWDDFEPHEYQEWCEGWATKVRRPLKPGGHLLAFSGTRTYHRLASGVEDAGVDIRDKIDWLYGSGFPKSLDVSKAIDKAEGADREVVGTREADDIRSGNYGQGDSIDGDKQGERTVYEYTAPATPEAERWDGWKTCLKPAHEPIVVGRTPLSEGTIAENVLEHGTGALNIDGCRLEPGEGGNRGGEVTAEQRYTERGSTNMAAKPGPRGGSSEGRYPSNVVLDEATAARLDAEVGELTSGSRPPGEYGAADGDVYDGGYTEELRQPLEGSKGGPSRFFYTGKATRAERTMGGRIENDHPTVKPVDLMEWLVTLVTREGQIVLDPFAGSGTTCVAAKNTGRKFVGIEKDSEYADIARVRAGLEARNPDGLTDDGQAVLDAFDTDVDTTGGVADD